MFSRDSKLEKSLFLFLVSCKYAMSATIYIHIEVHVYNKRWGEKEREKSDSF